MAKFKVGDRVRVAKTPTNGGYGEIGDTGTIKTVDAESVYLAFDSGKWKGDSWWISTDEIEPVAPQLTIRAGHYYRTRDGRKTGPMEEEDCGDGYPWTAENGGYYDDSGKRQSGYTPTDLIAEWVDEPAVTGDSSNADIFDEIEDWMAENPLPHVAEATSGKRETFTVRDARLFIVDGDGGWTQISGKKPAIVALIENGQPKPATRPFVHPDREAAKREAKRLAGHHKGKEFGVYELVDTAKESRVYEHEWQRMAANKKTGDAAKEMRKLTGLSLGDSKRAVERWLGKAA